MPSKIDKIKARVDSLKADAARLSARVDAAVPNREGLDQIENKWKEHGVSLDLSHSRNGFEINKISMPKHLRGKGLGSSAMKDITEHADKHGHVVGLTPGTEFGGSSVGRLKTFYKRHGFVENSGKNKDFSTRRFMYRNPKSASRDA